MFILDPSKNVYIGSIILHCLLKKTFTGKIFSSIELFHFQDLNYNFKMIGQALNKQVPILNKLYEAGIIDTLFPF